MNSMNEKMNEFDNFLAILLGEYGFKKKRKHVFIRKQGDCLQHISILETKVRGKSQVHIMVCVGFQYEKIDKVIYFIQNKEYDAKWVTANINIDMLMNTKVPYRFYISENTELKPIIQDILHVVECYALNFWESCNTMEKYEKKLLEKDRIVVKSTAAQKRAEWNLLALAIILGHKTVDEIIEEYEEDFQKNLPLLQVAKERIKQYDVLKEVGV